MELVNMQVGLTDQQKMLFMSKYNSDKKDRTLALILSILLGTLGIDRFYIGDMGIGILNLLTAGVCGILYIIDRFMIMGKTDEYNRSNARDILAAIKVSEESSNVLG